MIITMISINQQRSHFLVIEGTYIREQEHAALDYATMRLEHIANSKVYDEAMADGSAADVNNMTTVASFGPDAGETKVEDYDDIDDFHEYTESVKHALSADTFRFEVSYAVRYVDPSNPSQPTASPTLAKELTVNVVSADTIGNRVAKYSGSKITIATND